MAVERSVCSADRQEGFRRLWESRVYPLLQVYWLHLALDVSLYSDVHYRSLLHAFQCCIAPPSITYPKFSHNLTAVAHTMYFGLLV